MHKVGLDLRGRRSFGIPCYAVLFPVSFGFGYPRSGLGTSSLRPLVSSLVLLEEVLVGAAQNEELDQSVRPAGCSFWTLTFTDEIMGGFSPVGDNARIV